MGGNLVKASLGGSKPCTDREIVCCMGGDAGFLVQSIQEKAFADAISCASHGWTEMPASIQLAAECTDTSPAAARRQLSVIHGSQRVWQKRIRP